MWITSNPWTILRYIKKISNKIEQLKIKNNISEETVHNQKQNLIFFKKTGYIDQILYSTFLPLLVEVNDNHRIRITS